MASFVVMAGRVAVMWIEELEGVYRARVSPLRRVARAITGDAELARDVVQDVPEFAPVPDLENLRSECHRYLDDRRLV